MIINSDYNYVQGDAGCFAKYAKVFYEQNKIDTTGAATAQIGQLLFSGIFTRLFGFSLKNLHISVYFADFLFLVAMYFLLFELGLNRFLALIGSLSLLISPISLKIIDSFMSEPFFLVYLIFAMLFFIKGLRSERFHYIYLGGIFGSLAVLTRQHGISLSIALIAVCLIHRKKIQKGTFRHCIISALLPVISIALYYLTLYIQKRFLNNVPYAYAPENIAIIKSLLNPVNLIKRLYFDGLFFLHYSSLYVSALFIVLLLYLLLNPKMTKGLFSHFNISLFSLLYVSIGTFFLYAKNNRLMPYIPSIFSIGFLTSIFEFKVIEKRTASVILTFFTSVCAIILLLKLLEYFLVQPSPQQEPSSKIKKVGKKAKGLKKIEIPFDPGKSLIYLWAVVYIIVTILVGLRYDRYILPFSIPVIFIILSNFSGIAKNKTVLIVVFALFFSIFIYKITYYRLTLDLEWEAGEYLIRQGIPAYKINCGLGFNNFYSFEEINELYKNVPIKRPINWQLFHPLAHFFVKSAPGLEERYPSLVLYKSFSKQRWFGFFKRTFYIYKRKTGYTKPIWL